MNVSRVYQRASQVLLLRLLSAGLHMQNQTLFLHDKRFYNVTTSASGHAQSPNVHTFSMRPATVCAVDDQRGVLFAAIKSFVKTQTACHVCQRASQVLQLFFLRAASFMRQQIRFWHGRRFYHRDTSDYGHAQSPTAHTAGMRHAAMCAGGIRVGVRFVAILPINYAKTQTACRVF
jgi:hypothetical protein